MLQNLARFCVRRRREMVGLWLVLLVVLGIAAGSMGGMSHVHAHSYPVYEGFRHIIDPYWYGESADGEAPDAVRAVLFANDMCSVTRLVPKEQDKKNYERSLYLGRTDKEIESETKELARQHKADNPQALSRASFSAHHVISVCLDTYVRRCRSYNIAQGEALLMLIDAILNGLRIVAVSVDGYSQGMSVFEALNARGQPLTVDQLFKNVLMLTFTEKVQHDVIDEAWEGDRLSFESMVPESSHRDKFLLHYHRAFFGHVQKRMLYASFKKK